MLEHFMNKECPKRSENITEIDFDEASDLWMQNKLKLSHGMFKYICGKITKKGYRCHNNINCHLHRKSS